MNEKEIQREIEDMQYTIESIQRRYLDDLIEKLEELKGKIKNLEKKEE